MFSKLDIPLHGPSLNIVRQCGPALSDILQSKYGCVATIEGVDFKAGLSVAQQKRPTVAPEKRFEVRLASGIKVSVWKGDLTSFQAEAVVNAANERLQHYGGLAYALSNVGGPNIQKDSDDHIRKYGILKTGEAVVMDAGMLPCKAIIHAVGPQLPQPASFWEVSWAEPLLQKAIRSILDKVKEKHLKTVAIPAISSGIFNYPLSKCADTIVTTVKRYYEQSSGLNPEEVMFVNNDEPTVQEMERACCQILTLHSPMPHSQSAASKRKGGGKNSAMTVQISNIQLTLKKGRIEDQQTDVIVNTTYGRNLNNGQISKALLQKAGSTMQKDMDTQPMTGNVIITKSYKLQCKEVYHILCDEWVDYKAKQSLSKAVMECLWLAATKSYRSITFPAIGTGGFRLGKKDAALIMSTAVADFATKFPKEMDVYFVIFPSDDETFKAFEEQMRSFRGQAAELNFVQALDDRAEHRSSTPQISLSGASDAATREAERWLHHLLFEPSGTVICNNFILHFGEEDFGQLSRLMKHGVKIEELFDRGRASILVHGDSMEDVAVAGLQVEAMLCNTQREFIKEEEDAMSQMLNQGVSFKRMVIDRFCPEFSDRISAFKHLELQVVKVDRVENAGLTMLFELKKNQLRFSATRRMFQRIPAQFCDMVCQIGFHAECAPPDEPAYGEGIYFTSSVKKAMEVWKDPHWEYVHFVEAEVLTGTSVPGKAGLLLPPAVGTDPHSVYNSVSGGSEISVVFSGYQALPKYIITCKIQKV